MTNVTWVPYCMDCDEQLLDTPSGINDHDCPNKDLYKDKD